MTDHYSDPDMVWNEANAASDDGEAVMRAEREAGATDAELEAQAITVLVKRWPQAIETARKAVQSARRILDELMCCDVEMFDSSAGDEATEALREALRRLDSAGVIARNRLKPIEEAEKNAELDRLRARNAELERQLAESEASRG
ncbi:MAG TPA: hypothetical protein VK586_15800 [Streptosporangiaceae bacterium]|nr:hypothetical protein [Streptosporangiaceae bacterium]